MMKLARRVLALLLAVLLILPMGISFATAETTEKTVVAFSKSDGETKRLLYGKQFYVDWKSGDGLPEDSEAGKGADLSGSGANGAHKKMVFKTTLTFNDLQGDIDLQNCFKQIAIRMRSGRIDGQEKACNFVYLNPQNLTLTDGKAEIAIPLTDFSTGGIDWSDVRQLIVWCEVADAYVLPAEAESSQLSMTLSDTRIVREYAEGEVDTDELTDLVSATIKEEDFTPDSVASYNAAVQAGKDLLADETATQEQVDAAAAAIKEAKKNLVSSAVVYKDKLQELVYNTPLPDLDDPVIDAVRDAQTAAAPLLAKEDATQKQVNDAVLAIMKAKLAYLSKYTADDRFEERAAFSAINQSWSYLSGGKTFYTDWKSLDTPGFDATGSAENGADRHLYLQLQVAFTALSAEADVENCWSQLGVRLRSSAADGQLKEADFLYLRPDQGTYNEDGWWTFRIPLRVIATANINWADVQQLNVTADVNPAYYVTDETGVPYGDNSTEIGFTLGNVSLVEKPVYPAGDANLSGIVTVEDALAVLQHVTGKVVITEKEQLDVADVDGVDGLTVGDALVILQVVTGKVEIPEKEEEKLVAFTFDDGPGAYTAELLDGLKERGVHATFFVQGNHVEQYPELVTRMAEEGHAVGNHTYSHQDMRSLSDEQVVQEIQKCSDLIEKYTGEAPTLLRGPGFVVDERGTAYLKANNMRQINCSKSVRDHDQPDKQVIFDLFMKDGECIIEDGDIVLLHEVNQPSAQVALELIDIMLAQGYKLVTVQELLDARANGGIPGVRYDRVISLD